MDAVTSNHQRSESVKKQHLSNGHGPHGGRAPKYGDDKVRNSSPTRDFSSPPPGIQGDIDINDPREIRQTKKVLEAFFQGITSKTGPAEEIRMGSRRRFQEQSNLGDSRAQSSGNFVNSGRAESVRIPLNGQAAPNDGSDLYLVMSGQMRAPRKHKSDISLISSDSADSGGQNGTFHRTRSFTKAQRQSVVTELQNRDKMAFRRSSEDAPQTLPLYSERQTPSPSRHPTDTPKRTPSGARKLRKKGSKSESFQSSSSSQRDQNGQFQSSLDTTTDKNQSGSSVVHTRAISDPVVAKYDATGKRKNHSKEKKSWLKTKFFKKKKDGHKQKDSSKDSAIVAEVASGAALNASNGTKVTKSYSDRLVLSREDSTRSQRRTSPPPTPDSPRRTPNMVRKLMSSIKKPGKTESFSSLSSSRENYKSSGSKSLDISLEDGYEVTNGDSKSNSLPTDVKLAIKPLHDGDHKKHGLKDKDNKTSSSVAVDGFLEHPGKSGRKSRDAQRPNTLDLPKKKSSGWKKLKKIFVDSSSSSSSCSHYSSDGDIPSTMKALVERDAKESGTLPEGTEQINRHSEPMGTVSKVRKDYQHRATKSMNDIDHQDKNLADIGKKLQRVALGFAQQYRGPTGRTHTPDSYRQEMNRSHTGPSPVIRSTSHISTPSMKAYYNMGASRAKGPGETGNRRPRSRITRDEIKISHRPSGSFDSPHRGVIQEVFSDRIQIERLQKSEVNPEQHHQNKPRRPDGTQYSGESPHTSSAAEVPLPPRVSSSPSGVPLPPRVSSSPSPHRQYHPPGSHPSRSSRNSPRGPPPAPTMSTSPNLRSSRLRRSPQRGESSSTVVADSIPYHHHDHHIHREQHIDRTTTAVAAGHTRTVHIHRDIVDDVEADAVPIDAMEGFDSTDIDDMAMAFADDDDVTEITDRTETITVIEEVDIPAASSPERRPRAATTPTPTMADEDELDGDDEVGAVGGEEMDEDKLVSKIVEALLKKAEEIDLEGPPIEKELFDWLKTHTKEKAKEIMERALDKLRETTTRFAHPDIIELALIFEMFGLFRSVVSRPALLQSFINPILNQFGGWFSDGLWSSLDETEREILEKDGPSTSRGPHRRDRRRSDSDPDEKDP